MTIHYLIFDIKSFLLYQHPFQNAFSNILQQSKNDFRKHDRRKDSVENDGKHKAYFNSEIINIIFIMVIYYIIWYRLTLTLALK